MQDHSNNIPPKEIFANNDTFRAELDKLDPEKQNVEQPEVVEIDNTPPDDVQKALEEQPAPELHPEVELEASEETTEAPAKGHLIPKSRFNQEIEKRKTLEAELSKEREERIRYETQLQMLDDIQKQRIAQELQQRQIQQQSEAENIDPLDTDTYNYAKREIDSLKQQLATVAADTEARTREMFNINTVTAQETAFTVKHPDFKQAMEHVQQVELDIAKGLFATEQQAQNYVADKLKHALTNSLNAGRNAAETIYNMAKTYGFNSQPKVAPKPKVNVEAIAKNMDATANTSNIGNNATFGNMPADIKSALDKFGRVDSDLFHKQLERIQRNN